MSKSKGNVIDPLELIDRYGADALRFTICALTGPGRDIKLGPSRVESHRSFVTKLWNAARFCEMNAIAPDASFDPSQATLPLTRWILAAASDAVAEATAALEAYRFDEYAAACYRFAWNVFCDWFLEFAKPALRSKPGSEAGAAAHVLGVMLRLLHPAMPFVTEELWDRLGYGAPCSLIRAPWPAPFAVPDAARGARRTRLGGAADRRGAHGARRDERAALAARPGAAEGRRPSLHRTRPALGGGDRAAGARGDVRRRSPARCRAAARRRCWTRRPSCCRSPA